MSRSNIPYETAKALVERVTQEIGCHLSDKSGYLKVEHPATRHRVYVQHGKTLGRIDTTLPIKGEPGTYPLKNPNGSIVCHIEATLDDLERFVRMLSSTELAKQVPNKPRPFAATKGPTPRNPKPVIVVSNGVTLLTDDRSPALLEKLSYLKERSRLAKLRRAAEERGELEPVLDEAVTLERVDEDDALESVRNSHADEIAGIVSDAGIVID